MKLTSIISAWADTCEFLPYVIKNHLEFCDNVIIVWSQHSNKWEKNDAVLEYILGNRYDTRVQFVQLEPMRGLTSLANETRKRNYGLDIARQKGFTHFLISDADEFYLPHEMNEEKKRFNNPALNGIVHPLKVFIWKPTLWCEDHTKVPGIHKLQSKTYVGNFREYPFTFDENGAHIDPSRRPNYLSGIERSEVYMQHYSYVRKDIDLKIDNSTARLERSRQIIYRELREAKPGYLSKLYHRPLRECPNYFGIEI